MTCEQVRDQLAEHLLGTLEPPADAEVRLHLRGCASCRVEMTALAEGVSTFAAAAHDVEPPGELRAHVLGVLEEEWTSAGGPLVERTRRSTRILRFAGVAALAAALAWGSYATIQAARYRDAADKYESFLGVLGGEDVRVGELEAVGPHELQGSVVIYDSKVGQSWVLVLVRSPDREGTANVTLIAGDRRIDLHPMEFGPGGEASTWLVTASELTHFDRVSVWTQDGQIATADVVRE